MLRSYANECKKKVRLDVEIPMGLGCRNAIHKNFGGVIPLIQRASLGKKILRIGILKYSYKNPSILQYLDNSFLFSPTNNIDQYTF